MFLPDVNFAQIVMLEDLDFHRHTDIFLQGSHRQTRLSFKFIQLSLVIFWDYIVTLWVPIFNGLSSAHSTVNCPTIIEWKQNEPDEVGLSSTRFLDVKMCERGVE